MAALLELKNVSKAFGGLQVISGLDFHVDEHEIVSVIGPNGAGKTTLFNLITGLYRPDEGEILVEGRNVVGMTSHKIANLGIHGYLAIVVIKLTPIQHKAPSRQVEEVHGFSSRRCWRRLRYVGAPVLVDRKMDHGAIDYDFLQIDLAPPERNKPQAHGEMVHPEQWRVGIKLSTVYSDPIQIDTQAGQPEGKVAKLNASSGCLLGTFDNRGDKVAVECTAAHNHDAGGQE